jgi:hypothetical protein
VKQIVVCAAKITPRVEYTVKILLGQNAGVTDSSPEHSCFLIAYGRNDIKADLVIPSDGLLFESGLRWYKPTLPDQANLLSGEYDVFSLSFFLLSRYEEYSHAELDKHGRFPAERSWAAEMNVLHIPWVDVIRQHILREARDKGFSIIDNASFQVIHSFDIDHAYAFKHKGLIRQAGAILKDITRCKFLTIIQRFLVLAGWQTDPYDTYEYIHKSLNGRKALFFIHVGNWFPPYDSPVSTHNKHFRNLIKKLSEFGEVGIHPSYFSNSESRKVQAEIDRLTSILSHGISKSRQHFLRVSFPDTYHALIKCGIREDYTMGWASRTGFRAGTSRPFVWFDISIESETELIVFPFVCMDGTLNEYLNLNKDNALDVFYSLVNEVKKHNGTLILLWHNHSLSNLDHWKGWKEVYEEMSNITP